MIVSKYLTDLQNFDQILIKVFGEKDTMPSVDIDLVCGLNFLVGCQDRLCVNLDVDEALQPKR